MNLPFDTTEKSLIYANRVTSLFLADAQPEERSALRLMLQDLKMIVVGEAVDWVSAIEIAPATQPDMLLVDFSLISDEPGAALAKMRLACANAIVIILLSQLDTRQQTALYTGADEFISKNESSERVAEHLRAAAKRARSYKRIHIQRT